MKDHASESRHVSNISVMYNHIFICNFLWFHTTDPSGHLCYRGGGGAGGGACRGGWWRWVCEDSGQQWLSFDAVKHQHHAKRLCLHAIIFPHSMYTLWADTPLTLPPLKTPPPAALSLADAADSPSQRSKSTKVREVCATSQTSALLRANQQAQCIWDILYIDIMFWKFHILTLIIRIY